MYIRRGALLEYEKLTDVQAKVFQIYFCSPDLHFIFPISNKVHMLCQCHTRSTRTKETKLSPSPSHQHWGPLKSAKLNIKYNLLYMFIPWSWTLEQRCVDIKDVATDQYCQRILSKNLNIDIFNVVWHESWILGFCWILLQISHHYGTKHWIGHQTSSGRSAFSQALNWSENLVKWWNITFLLFGTHFNHLSSDLFWDLEGSHGPLVGDHWVD